MPNELKYPIQAKSAETALIRISLEDSARFSEFMAMPPDAFYHCRNLAKELQGFWVKHHIAPDTDSFKTWSQDEQAKEQLALVSERKLPDHTQFSVYANIVRECLVGRSMLAVAESLANTVGKDPHPSVLQDAIAKLNDASFSISERAHTTRAWYWETAPERWDRFKARSKDPSQFVGIKFGIPPLDKVTHGLHSFESEADLVAIFAKGGMFKTTLIINAAMNQAEDGNPIMFIEREMARERFELLLDARESIKRKALDGVEPLRLEYNAIQDYSLIGRYRKRYASILKNLNTELKTPLWLVDCPDQITTADIVQELETFKSINSIYPKAIYLDYANLVDPVGEWQNTSEKMDRVFLELLGICKGYGVPIVTPIRESRLGSLVKDRGEVDMEHVGLSQAISYTVHQLWHLDATKEERLRNRVMCRIKKNRYGELAEIPLVVDPGVAFIGAEKEVDDWDL